MQVTHREYKLMELKNMSKMQIWNLKKCMLQIEQERLKCEIQYNRMLQDRSCTNILQNKVVFNAQISFPFKRCYHFAHIQWEHTRPAVELVEIPLAYCTFVAFGTYCHCTILRRKSTTARWLRRLGEHLRLMEE